MSILKTTEKPLYYAGIYISTSSPHTDLKFKKTASMLVAMASTELGYSGFESENAADGQDVCICYWDTYDSLSRWKDKAEKFLTPSEFGLNALLCTTGCLWPWLMEKRKIHLETSSIEAA